MSARLSPRCSAQDYPGRFFARAGRRPQQRRHRRDRARRSAFAAGAPTASPSSRRAPCRRAGPASSGRSPRASAPSRRAPPRPSSTALHRRRHRAPSPRTSPSSWRALEAGERDLVSLMVRLQVRQLRRAIPHPGLRVLLRHALSLRLGRTIRAGAPPPRRAAASWSGASAYRAHRRLRRDPRRADRRLRAGAR